MPVSDSEALAGAEAAPLRAQAELTHTGGRGKMQLLRCGVSRVSGRGRNDDGGDERVGRRKVERRCQRVTDF